ncbi:MAG: hypothetical protein MJ162_01275 [Treponema sp.]|nr:hypothetical protein [Treponema sp.]
MNRITRIISTVIVSTLLSASLFAQISKPQKPIVQDIQAKVGKGVHIEITWTLPKNSEPITSLRLYRSTKPVTTYTQINRMNYIAQLNPDATGYIDSVYDYNDYFYAVIAVTDKPYDFVLVSMNSTVNGVHLLQENYQETPVNISKNDKLYESGTMRETPLPYLDYIEGLNQEPQVSKESLDVAAALIADAKTTKRSEKVTPYFFEEDLISPDSGDDYLLFDILKNTFVQEKYEEAILQLNKLTGTRNISQAIISRAIFYIGEAEYFTGNYEEAVKYFVQLQQTYPLLTTKWINASLDKIMIN